VKPAFANLTFRLWQHDCRLGESLPTLCIQGAANDATGLLAAIDELAQETPPAARTLTTRGHDKPNAVTKIRLGLVAESGELRQMFLGCEGSTAHLEFTLQGLESFRQAVDLWMNGAEDFSIHPHGSRKARDIKRHDVLGQKDLDSGELWFWTTGTDP